MVVGAVVGNINTYPKISTTYTYSYTKTVSDSYTVGGELSGSILKLVNAKVSATYAHSVVQSFTFTQGFGNIDILPGKQAAAVGSVPVFRVAGNFVVIEGNTTYNINNVYFDYPDDTGTRPNHVDIETVDYGKPFV